MESGGGTTDGWRRSGPGNDRSVFDMRQPQDGREALGGYYEGTHPVFQQNRFFTALRPMAGRSPELPGGPV